MKKWIRLWLFKRTKRAIVKKFQKGGMPEVEKIEDFGKKGLLLHYKNGEIALLEDLSNNGK